LSCGGWIIGASAAVGATACEDALGLTTMAAEMLAGAPAGQNGRHAFARLSWQPVFGRLAGYENVNGAERLRHDAAIRAVFIRWEREFLELNFLIQRIFCVFL
jgi:hypothetical protein